jgi:PKHD-type hydroxylase
MLRLTTNPKTLWKNTHSSIYWDDLFSETDLQKMDEYCKLHGTNQAKIVTSEGPETNNSTRNSEIYLHSINQDNQWLFDRLLQVTSLINDTFYNFDLLGFDHFQYTEYNGVGTKYDYHTDMIFGDHNPVGMEVPRKLSFSLILSDSSEYEGGDFELLQSRVPIKLEQKRGRILAFPSYILHRVAPIISGSRRSIVFWALGPKFK